MEQTYCSNIKKNSIKEGIKLSYTIWIFKNIPLSWTLCLQCKDQYIRGFFFSETVIVTTFIQTLGKRKWSDKYCWKDNRKGLWFFPACTVGWTKARAVQVISILSQPHISGWAGFGWEAAAGISLVQERSGTVCATLMLLNIWPVQNICEKRPEKFKLSRL